MLSGSSESARHIPLPLVSLDSEYQPNTVSTSYCQTTQKPYSTALQLNESPMQLPLIPQEYTLVSYTHFRGVTAKNSYARSLQLAAHLQCPPTRLCTVHFVKASMAAVLPRSHQQVPKNRKTRRLDNILLYQQTKIYEVSVHLRHDSVALLCTRALVFVSGPPVDRYISATH